MSLTSLILTRKGRGGGTTDLLNKVELIIFLVKLQKMF